METAASPPLERGLSPEPWATPSPALGALPQLDRSVSTASSVSSVSGRSASSRLSDSGIPGKRRGYMRPEGTKFSQSARNRDSVMNLGTIAHLQYYFARTGLLDTATGRVAKSRKGSSRTSSGTERPLSGVDGDLLSTDGEHLGEGFVESPIDDTASVNWEDGEPMMLPPTVSTYKNNPVYVPPPPDMVILRRELRESLDEAMKHLKELEKGFGNMTDDDLSVKAGDGTIGTTGTTNNDAVRHSADAPGWYEIQGLNLLDVATLAIRAAKNYYTAHEEPQRLYAIRSERTIRKELYEVLEILKRLAIRNFANGVQPYEVSQIKTWVTDIGQLLDTEDEKEKAEQEERESWTWRKGDWTGKERERELLFLRSFDPNPETLPEWSTPDDDTQLPTPFLQELQNGLRLVHLHNALVRKSRRQFEEIKQYHTDTAKPYRCADNLRYWVKSAELRWDIKLDVDVMGVVHGEDAALRKLDAAVLKWAAGVREEITMEWTKLKNQIRTPTLQIDPHYEAL